MHTTQVNNYFNWKTCICLLIKQLIIDNRLDSIQTNHWGKCILKMMHYTVEGFTPACTSVSFLAMARYFNDQLNTQMSQQRFFCRSMVKVNSFILLWIKHTYRFLFQSVFFPQVKFSNNASNGYTLFKSLLWLSLQRETEMEGHSILENTLYKIWCSSKVETNKSSCIINCS